ncbi:MAG: flagellar biosynthesis protein FliR [Synergistaceae bacterium]|nr:flagellar biosynthesis protein FliR [Synergistota bacterium]NLM71634.1 flagellar biosynthesis protein FliR [Synergistaceae bacterium]
MPVVNIQALIALALFIASLLLARMIVRIQTGTMPGGRLWVLYLRMLLGFLFAGSIILAFYSFAGVDVISKHL